MHFNRFGRTYQLRIDHAEDLEQVAELDEALWVATSAPLGSFRCDEGFTRILDADGNGRIQSDEVKAAVRWLWDVLTDRSRLASEENAVALAAVNQGSTAGRDILQAARYILDRVGGEQKERITLEQVRGFLEDLRLRPLNGDGIIVPESAEDDAVRTLIADVISCMGAVPDSSGKDGMDEARLQAFTNEVKGLLAWRSEAILPDGVERTDLLPFGAATDERYAVYCRHAREVDLFFVLCRAVRFVPEIAVRIGCPDARLQDLDFLEADDIAACLSQEPIAAVSEGDTLPLAADAVNPRCREWIETFRRQIADPLLGDHGNVLDEAGWRKIKAVFEPYAAYLSRKKGSKAESLPSERLQRYADGTVQAQAARLIAVDRDVATVRDGARALEKLLLFHRWLLPFANNFVCFSHLYSQDQRALFEHGSAVIDGRWFNLAVPVDNMAAHSAIAQTGSIFTLYLELTAKTDAERRLVAVPATAGTRGNLTVGKRGVFFDTGGKQFDARVVNLIENPISVREALAAPFVRLWQFIVGKIEALSGAREKDLQKSVDDAMNAAPAPPAAAEPAAAAGGRIPGGPAALIVGLSVSAAAIASSFAFVTKSLANVTPVQRLIGLVGAVLVVGVPVTLSAILKMRRQDLSVLLEGSGWAINARMRFTRALRTQFTGRPPYPRSASGIPRRRWLRPALWSVLILLLVVYLVRHL